jgi:hypothetical protein
MLSEPVPGAGI